MTAMPPTVGHSSLIEYASLLSESVTVIVCTQPGEPMVSERVKAIREFSCSIYGTVRVEHLHKTVPQEPEEEEEQFWSFWVNVLRGYGFEKGDYIVSSEEYGLDLAKASEGIFMPYDLRRFTSVSKATNIRNTINLEQYQRMILPEFMRYIRRTVTIFGAESVGKTTVTREAGRMLQATITPEWARPYLETVGGELTVEHMKAIVLGQTAIQDLGYAQNNTVYTIQDTDLFSTLGYWEMWDNDTVPEDLLEQARHRASDLYVILGSDFPFEQDPLRYGGDHRETKDQYWIDLCERENLPYIYVTGVDRRGERVVDSIREVFKVNPLSYQRVGKEYEEVYK